MLIEWVVAGLLLLGSLFVLVGAVSLVRLPDFYMRLHGPTKASTLGVGALMLASVVFFSGLQGSPALSELLITVFLLITAPVSAHLLAKSALHDRVPRHPATRGKPWQQ